MLDIMYEMPGMDNLKEVVITEEVIVTMADPILVYLSEDEMKEREREAEENKDSEPEFGTGGSGK